MDLPMKWTSILAIYVLFWISSAFILLPFGVRTNEEAGVAKVPGQADSAPIEFRPGRIALRATILSLIVTTLYILNYAYGWIEARDLIFWGPTAD